MKKVVVFLAIVAFSTVAGINETTIKSVALMTLKKDSSQYVGICKAVGTYCRDGASIWKEKNSNDIFYLTLPQLRLMKLKKDADIYSKVIIWDFSKENNNDSTSTSDDELTKGDLYIYPALYPLNKTKMAIALVSKWSTSYSGGSREEEYANFMMINDDGSYQLAFKNIPFSSRKMIKACFTEKDYAKKSHCHDESWSILNLKITDDSQAFYSWKFITKSYDWPAFTNKSSAKLNTHESFAYPFQLRQQLNN